MKSSKPPRVPWYALCQAHTISSPVSTPAPKMNTVCGQTGCKFVLFQSCLHAIPRIGIRNEDRVCTFGFTQLYDVKPDNTVAGGQRASLSLPRFLSPSKVRSEGTQTRFPGFLSLPLMGTIVPSELFG